MHECFSLLSRKKLIIILNNINETRTTVKQVRLAKARSKLKNIPSLALSALTDFIDSMCSSACLRPLRLCSIFCHS